MPSKFDAEWLYLTQHWSDSLMSRVSQSINCVSVSPDIVNSTLFSVDVAAFLPSTLLVWTNCWLMLTTCQRSSGSPHTRVSLAGHHYNQQTLIQSSDSGQHFHSLWCCWSQTINFEGMTQKIKNEKVLQLHSWISSFFLTKFSQSVFLLFETEEIMNFSSILPRDTPLLLNIQIIFPQNVIWDTDPSLSWINLKVIPSQTWFRTWNRILWIICVKNVWKVLKNLISTLVKTTFVQKRIEDNVSDSFMGQL